MIHADGELVHLCASGNADTTRTTTTKLNSVHPNSMTVSLWRAIILREVSNVHITVTRIQHCMLGPPGLLQNKILSFTGLQSHIPAFTKLITVFTVPIRDHSISTFPRCLLHLQYFLENKTVSFWQMMPKICMCLTV
jgi:hypothetical protein